jgi:meckelin
VTSYLTYNFNTTISTNNIQLPKCEKCPNGAAASLDRSRCIICPQGVDLSSGECLCPANSAVIEKDIAGSYLTTKQCLICPLGSFPGPSQPVYSCKACPIGKIYDTNVKPWKCSCDLASFVTAGDTCISITESQFITTNYPVNIAKSLSFNNEETLDKNIDGQLTIASSDTIDYLYLKSGYECMKYSNPISCQILANLCVLQLYDLNNPICKLYNYINNLKPSISGSE